MGCGNTDREVVVAFCSPAIGPHVNGTPLDTSAYGIPYLPVDPVNYWRYNCVKLDGNTPTQADIGKWVVKERETYPANYVTDWIKTHLYQGTGIFVPYGRHWRNQGRIVAVYPPVHIPNQQRVVDNLITDPNAIGCPYSPIIPSWNCKIDKFGNTGCASPGDGTGIYNSLQDCQNNCTSGFFHAEEDRFKDIISPWIDPGGGPCLHDIITCPCGWDYVQNYQPPTVPVGQPPPYTQYAGASVCLSPYYALWESSLGINTFQVFAGLISPFSLPCAELQGVYNPTVGMAIEGSPTLPQGNWLAGYVHHTIDNVIYTDTWDSYVIVEVNPAYNSSILNVNQQVIQSFCNQ